MVLHVRIVDVPDHCCSVVFVASLHRADVFRVRPGGHCRDSDNYSVSNHVNVLRRNVALEIHRSKIFL